MLQLRGEAIGVATFGWDAGRRDRRLLLPAAIFLVACGYDVYVGGDVWEKDTYMRANRFLVYVMPLVFVLFNALINRVVAARDSRRTVVRGPSGRDVTGDFFVALATTVAFLIANGLWLSSADPETWPAFAVLEPPYNAQSNGPRYREGARLRRRLPPAPIVATTSPGIPAVFTAFRMVDLFADNERHLA